MKKLFVIIGIMFSLFLLTGCSTNEDEREAIVKTLIKEDIIEGKKYEEVDVMHYTRYALEWCERDDYYIYENKDGDKVAITFNRRAGSKPKKYDVVVYYKVEEESNMEYYDEEPESCSEPLYKTNDGKPAKTAKYKVKESKKYLLTQNGKKYTVEEEKKDTN